MPAELAAGLPPIQTRFKTTRVACRQSQQNQASDITAILATKMAVGGRGRTTASTNKRDGSIGPSFIIMLKNVGYTWGLLNITLPLNQTD